MITINKIKIYLGYDLLFFFQNDVCMWGRYGVPGALKKSDGGNQCRICVKSQIKFDTSFFNIIVSPFC